VGEDASDLPLSCFADSQQVDARMGSGLGVSLTAAKAIRAKKQVRAKYEAKQFGAATFPRAIERAIHDEVDRVLP
jgi:hypothetical protein